MPAKTLPSPDARYLSFITYERDRPIINNLYALSAKETNQYEPAEQKIKLLIQRDIETFQMLEDAHRLLMNTVRDAEKKLAGGAPVPPSVREELIKINSAFLSFLSIARLYLDHTASKISSKNPHILEIHKLATNEEFDNHFAYRFFSQLRNYAQHRGIPLTGMTAAGTINLKTKENDYNFKLFFHKNELLEYKKIWTRKVLPDLLDASDEILALPLISEYMECMARIRRKSIKAFLPLVSTEIKMVKSIIDKGQGKQPLYIVSFMNTGKRNEDIVGDAHFREVPIKLIEFTERYS
jgi:hypothetical protein